MATKSCTACGTQFQCTTSNNCWCMDFPKLKVLENQSDCFCPSCLINKLAKEVNHSKVGLSPEDQEAIKKLGPVEVPTQDIDYYMENGLLVMSKWFLLRRGYCCKNGCRHCPY